MKTMIIITITLALIAGAFTANSHINNVLDKLAGQPQKEVFQAFHYLHARQYQLNSQEGLNRYRIFKQNVQWAKAENSKLGKTVYGITKFSDMTHSEFVEKTLLKPEVMKANIDELNKKSLRFLHEEEHHDHHDHHDHHHHDHHHHDHHHHDDHHSNKTDAKEATKGDHNLKSGDIDHRQWDSAAKDQKTCGSCWAFAALAAIENKYHALTGKMTLFSEQYLVDCDNMDGGCGGGWPTNTFNWIAQNGIIHADVLKYEDSQGVCDSDKERYQYKIVTGADEFQKDSPFSVNNSWENMLAKGPMVVAMSASFEGFQSYRPDTLEALAPTQCGELNHAVTAVGLVTENGIEYIIVKNSWGVDWGYKGYFKITKSINCSITTYGWLPKVNKDGAVPSDNPPTPPKPTPEPSTDCVKLYGSQGFQANEIMNACDSVNEIDDYFFYGVKLPATTDCGKSIKVMVFPWQSCGGDWAQPIEQSTEFVQRDGMQAYMASLAFIKEAKAGCINFYTETCNKGDAAFTLCSDIKDTNLVNFTKLPQIKSILSDKLEIKRITFFTEAEFAGTAIEISGDALYNVDSNWKLGYYFKEGYVKSIKIDRN